MDSVTREILHNIKFTYGNTHYDFSSNIKIHEHITGFINNLYIIEQNKIKFIIKLCKDFNIYKYKKLLYLNKLATEHFVTIDYTYHIALLENNKPQIYCTVQPYRQHNHINIDNLNYKYIKQAAKTLSNLHNIPIDTEQKSIKEIIKHELMYLDLSENDTNKIIGDLNLEINTLSRYTDTADNNKFLCHIDPNIKNFLLSDENSYLIDFEYANVCDLTGVFWDLCYFIVNNKLPDEQKQIFINNYYELNNNSFIKTSKKKFNDAIQIFSKDVVLYNKNWYKIILESGKFNSKQKQMLQDNLDYYTQLLIRM